MYADGIQIQPSFPERGERSNTRRQVSLTSFILNFDEQFGNALESRDMGHPTIDPHNWKQTFCKISQELLVSSVQNYLQHARPSRISKAQEILGILWSTYNPEKALFSVAWVLLSSESTRFTMAVSLELQPLPKFH